MIYLIGVLIAVYLLINLIGCVVRSVDYSSNYETPGPITLGELLIPGVLLARVVPLMIKAFETPVSEIKFKRGKK